MTTSAPSPALRLVRVPGRFGPILRCSGELSVATVEALKRELALLRSLGRPLLTLNLTGCDSLDVDGILTVLETFRQLREEGRDLVVVAADRGGTRRLLHLLGVGRIVSLFSTEEAAMLSLQSGDGSEASAPAGSVAAASCRSVLEPIREAVRTGDRGRARAQVAAAIDAMGNVSLPEEGDRQLEISDHVTPVTALGAPEAYPESGRQLRDGGTDDRDNRPKQGETT